jgi:hypothetical protein
LALSPYPKPSRNPRRERDHVLDCSPVFDPQEIVAEIDAESFGHQGALEPFPQRQIRPGQDDARGEIPHDLFGVAGAGEREDIFRLKFLPQDG